MNPRDYIRESWHAVQGPAREYIEVRLDIKAKDGNYYTYSMDMSHGDDLDLIRKEKGIDALIEDVERDGITEFDVLTPLFSGEHQAKLKQRLNHD